MCDGRKRDEKELDGEYRSNKLLTTAGVSSRTLNWIGESKRGGPASIDVRTARNYLGGDMDDFYAINFAKTEFREAFNTGNPERLIALLDPAFVYMPDGVPAANGTGAADAIRAEFRELTARYNVQLLPIIIEIRIQDSVAWDYGWHTWRKTPRDGSPQVTVKNRYVDIWRKNEKGEWKLWMYMNNTDVPMQTPNGGLISGA
jgi:ketosteroid isomerase-like protein